MTTTKESVREFVALLKQKGVELPANGGKNGKPAEWKFTIVRYDDPKHEFYGKMKDVIAKAVN